MKCIYAILLVFTVLCGSLSAATYSSDQAAQGSEPISPQHYRFYIPDGVAVVRAVIIHQHGCGRSDWNTAWDVQWRALADKWDAALVSPYLEGSCNDWYNPSAGSWRCLNAALTEVGSASGHPELINAPMCVWGHSGGGDWVAKMIEQHPTRIVAAVSRSGGSDPGSAGDGIPTLVVRGSDSDIGTDVRSWFTAARSRGALISLARDLDQWHETADLRVLAIPFFDACLAQRLPAPTTGTVTLLPMDTANAWLGSQTTFAIASDASYSGTKTTASWLPTQIMAQKWSEFANPASVHGTGWATDTTAPNSAPWDVTASVSGTNVTLGWRARADLESGIKNFAIYRDSIKIANQGGGSGTSNVGGGFFQWGEFGDATTPSPNWPIAADDLWPFPATYPDASVSSGVHLYQVAVVNGEGMEGPKSASIPVTIGATDTQGPTLAVTSPASVVGGASATFTTSASTVSLSGTATDNVAVHSVVWSNSRGDTGGASGTTSWSIANIALVTGTNTIHVTAYDAANHQVTATLLVSRSSGGASSPTITAQPANRSVVVGQTAAFSIGASGTPTPTYVWRKNGTPIGGATSATYTTPITVIADNGAIYSAVATNSSGSVTSSDATLTVTSSSATSGSGTGSTSGTPVATPEESSSSGRCGSGALAGLLLGLLAIVNFWRRQKL